MAWVTEDVTMPKASTVLGITDVDSGIWYPHGIPTLALPGGCVPRSPPVPNIERPYASMAVHSIGGQEYRPPYDSQQNHDTIFSEQQFGFSEFFQP